MPIARTKVSFERGIMRRNADHRVGAKCLTCLKPVDSEKIVGPQMGSGKPYTEVLVRCHGQEALVTLDMGTEHWDKRDFDKQYRGQEFFNPNLVHGFARDE